MKDNLVGRIPEKNTLSDILKSDQPEFLVLYGRRRVGKTYLIRQYYRKNIAFDFTGSYQLEKQAQLDNFFYEYLQRTKAKKETSPPSDWQTAFRYLADYAKSLRKNKKHIIFIDELPWLDTHKSNFISALEYFWNQHISNYHHIALVVCGSANSWIQNKIIRAKGGLYNRVTRRLRLLPFTLSETETYFKSRRIKLTRYQIIQLYMVMGGIPHYLKEVKPGKSAIQNIDEICFTKTGLLNNEFDQLYPSIFNNVENHLAIIKVLSRKPQGMLRSELVSKSKLTDGGIFTRTLTELQESGFVDIFLPYQKKKKDALYKLADAFTLFYFKFIKNQKQSGKGTWHKLSQSSSYKAWSGYAFENICFSHIDQIKIALGISGINTNVSSWKFRGDKRVAGTQIDLLIERADLVLNICEAKFTQDPFLINKSYAKKLRERAAILKQTTKTKAVIFNTLITCYPAIQNDYYLENIQSEVTIEDLFT